MISAVRDYNMHQKNDMELVELEVVVLEREEVG